MPNIVDTVFDNGNDNALDLQSTEISRPLSIGSGWNDLVIAMSCQISYWTVTTSQLPLYLYYSIPQFMIGLTTGGSKFLTGNVQHAIYGAFTGMMDINTGTAFETAASDTRGTYGRVYQTGSLATSSYDAADTDGVSIEHTGSSYRSVIGCRFYRASDGEHVYVYPFIPDSDNLINYDAVDTKAIYNGLASGNISAFLNSIKITQPGYIYQCIVDEASYGPLDTLSVVWVPSTYTLRIHDIFIANWGGN